MFWSEIRPVTFPPVTSGTNRTDFGASPAKIELPYRSASAKTFSVISKGSRVSSTCFEKPPGGSGSACSRSPSSMMYG